MRRVDVPLLDDDPGLFEALPEWLVPGLDRSHKQQHDDGLGLRSLLERPEIVRKAPQRLRAYRRRSRAARRPHRAALSSIGERP